MSEKRQLFLAGTVLGTILGVFIFVMIYVFIQGNQEKIVPVNQISYQVNVDSIYNQAINEAGPNVVGVVRFIDDKEKGTGSGVIYKLDEEYAYIVTNNHVIDKGTKIEVVLKDEERVKADIIGQDVITDIAVIKISKGNIDSYMEFADSDSLKVGEFVFAIGNPLGLKFYGSATLGIVSSLERLLPIDNDRDGEGDWFANVIQTDAAINPGNSGGALVNIDGKLVGINSMKIANEQVEGLGFAIPSNIVQTIIADLELYGEVKRPFLGVHTVSMSQLTETQKAKIGLQYIDSGVYVNDVMEGSSAYTNGIRINDVITKVDDKKISNVTDFRLNLYEHELGDQVTFSIIRNNRLIHITLKLEAK